jgi:cytosine/adenosine deaminase-related metal-dependent hydrolase/SAM-dependent methyltransferase
MASSTATSFLTASDGYRLWASSYDREPNPLLTLERRILEPLLPPLKGLDILDVGCGTGRWLQMAKGTGARKLLGIDLSAEMLDQARAKLGEAATLWQGKYTDAPIAKASADLILCNFVLSYLDDPGAFLTFAATALRPSGTLFLTDMHPATASALSWRRGVRVQGEFQEIRTYEWTVAAIIQFCRDAGFAVRLLLEPGFGCEERIIFEENGKAEYFEEIREHPAIYMLHLTAQERSKPYSKHIDSPGMVAGISGARFALGPEDDATGDLEFSDSRVEAIHAKSHRKTSSARSNDIDLTGYLALPGLINAHDHLEFALFPKLGNGPYRNFLEWADDIHRTHAAEISRHRQVPKNARLWWGGIRNLLCGVTSVCHHNPYAPEVFSDGFPVRVLKDYRWAHSLRLDQVTAMQKTKANRDQRFFIHLGEGTDAESADEIFELHRQGALDENTVIIHGLGIGTNGATLLRCAGAGLVWCPSSNLFLFDKSLCFDDICDLSKVALGSDSPLTAEGDLLDEVRCAHQTLRTPATKAYQYVTQGAAHLLGLKNGEGCFRVGGFADLTVVRDKGLSPGETLAGLSYRDLELVLLGGRVQLASPQIKQRLPQNAVEGLQPLAIEGLVRWIRAPLDRLFAETLEHLRGPVYLGRRQVSLVS